MSDPDNPDRSKRVYDEAALIPGYLCSTEYIGCTLHYGLNKLREVDIVGIGNFVICHVLKSKMLSSRRNDFINDEDIIRPVEFSNPFMGITLA